MFAETNAAHPEFADVGPRTATHLTPVVVPNPVFLGSLRFHYETFLCQQCSSFTIRVPRTSLIAERHPKATEQRIALRIIGSGRHDRHL